MMYHDIIANPKRVLKPVSKATTYTVTIERDVHKFLEDVTPLVRTDEDLLCVVDEIKRLKETLVERFSK